jgi:alpha-L-fucosidase
MPNGLIHSNDVNALKELGSRIQELYGQNILAQSRLYCSSNEESISLADLTNFDNDTRYWKSDAADSRPVIEFELSEPQELNTIILKEQIEESQRLESGIISVECNGHWQEAAQFQTVGYQRIIEFPQVTATKIKIEFSQYREYATLQSISALLLK